MYGLMGFWIWNLENPGWFKKNMIYYCKDFVLDVELCRVEFMKIKILCTDFECPHLIAQNSIFPSLVVLIASFRGTTSF